jgi:inward rectifier potassium channel
VTAPNPILDDAPPPLTQPADLGFGSVVAQAVRGRFLNHDGTPVSKKYGLGAQRLARFYLASLNAGWTMFFSWFVGVLLLINGCFALAYMSLGSGELRGTEAMGVTDPFLQAFSYSVGVFSTTGFGTIHAYGATANWLSNLETIVGPVTLVIAFGLLIARLTRPRMRIGFSESAVIAPYQGGRAFMFRIVNLQPGELSDVQARVSLVRFEDVGGVRQRIFHQLPLERNSVEFFTLHWTVVHPITADSPLAGVTPESVADSQVEFLIFINALEETFSTRVSTRASYVWEELRWDVKFASIFANGPDGVIAIDVERLSRTERLDEGATRNPAPLERAIAPKGS